MNKVTCCYKCEERHYNCHAECEKYQALKPKYQTEKNSPYLEYQEAKWNRLVHKHYLHERTKKR